MPVSEDRGGRYRRLRPLGEGAAGRVWLVEDRLRRGPPLALKELAAPESESASGIEREFALLAALRHPNLVEVFDLSSTSDSGLPCFTLEHVEGKDLVAAARTEGPAVLLDLAVEALRALSFLHDFGLLHRDLKPGNLLVRDTPRLGCRLVVLDFGLSQRGEISEGALSSAVGTLPYMAPELLEGGAASRRSDLYALGAVLYEAVHGRPPFTVKSRDIGGFLRGVKEGRRVRLPLPEGYPAGFAQWLDEMIAADATLRPVDATEALGRLDAACRTEHAFETPATRAARLASGDPPGRKAEIEAIWKSLTFAAAPRIVWLCGAAGSGKSRVLRWLASDAVTRGFQVIAPPPGADLFEASLGPDRVGAGLADLRAKAAKGPTLLILDEVEAASGGLTELLDRIAREGREAPLRVVAALRPADVRDAKVKALVADTGIVPTLTRVDLDRLDLAGVRAMAERAGGNAAVSEARASWLLEVTEGDPHAVEELLVEGGWEKARSKRSFTPRAPGSARIDLLSRQGRAWLEGLAVLGQNVSEETVAAVAGLDAAPSDASREVEAAGLARRQGERWSPDSRSLAEEVRRRIEPERLRKLHRRGAETLEAADGERSDPWRLAQLWSAAGDTERAVTLAILAAEQAEHVQESAAAAERFRFAASLVSRRDPRRGDLRARQGEALLAVGDSDAAARAFAGAMLGARDDESRTKLSLRRAFALALAMKPKQSRVIAERALELAQRNGLSREQAEAKRIIGVSLLRLGSEREGIPWLEAAVKEAPDYRARAESLRDLGLSQSNLRLQEASESLRAALEIWRRLGDDSEELRALVGLSRDMMRHGHLDEGRTVLEETAQKARAARNQRMLQYALSLLSAIATHQARLDEAIHLSEEAADGALHLGNTASVISSRNNQGAALLASGRPSEAAEVIRVALDRFGDRAEPEVVDYSRALLACAIVETRGPNDSQARELLEVAARNGRARGSARQVLMALSMEMERRAHAQCFEPLDPVRAEFDALLKSSRLTDDAELLVRADLATAIALLKRGEAEKASEAAQASADMAESADLPIFAVRARLALSEILSALGRTDSSAQALERGRQLLANTADRIKDVIVRRDFLDRPVFRGLRTLGKSDAEERRLQALYDIIRALNSETDPEAILGSILDSALQVVQAERGMILLREQEGDEFAVRIARNLEKETVADLEAISHGIIAEAGTGKAVLAIDAGHDERFDTFQSIGLYGIRSLMCVPLRSRARIIGTVYLDSRREGKLFTEADLKFLEAFADHAALAVEIAQSRASLLEENRRLQIIAETRVQFGNIVGRSSSMQKVFDLVTRFAASELPVLIQGESGTGKELIAQAIHFNGPRKKEKFLSENCAAIAETLLESELFGHVRGAFTGAEKDHPGLFEQADGGTLFLDEVGDMAPAMQARLLRVLQEGELRRVGGDRPIKVDVRVLAATHRDLQIEVEAGRFREDLFYRLQVLLVQLPALRERPGDVALLVHHMLERISRERGSPAPKLDRDALDMLERYPWPGNVRQLENALHRLALLSTEGRIGRKTIESDDGLRLILMEPNVPVLSLERTKRDQIEKALKATEGNRERAAKLLGLSRATMYRKISEYRLGKVTSASARQVDKKKPL